VTSASVCLLTSAGVAASERTMTIDTSTPFSAKALIASAIHSGELTATVAP
jgi:hypothetical protein